MFKRVTVLAVATALAGGLLTIAPATTAVAATGPVVPATQFGMAVATIRTTTAPPRGYGTIRLWDSGVSWAELQPTSGAINWAPLDLAVSKARAAGMTDILYVLSGTPAWARIPSSAEVNDLPAPGRASHPAKDSYYVSFAKAVATRYKGKIARYEIWNESNLPTFYRGTPTQLANLTKSTYAAIKAIDPKATVTSPSWLLRYWAPQREAQLAALKKVGFPFDVVNVHTYPFATDGPNQRMSMVTAFKKRLTYYGVNKKIWDTEVNFGDRRPGYAYRYYPGAAGATLAARAYIDSLRLGIARTYWFAWESHELGIDMTTPGTTTPTAAATAIRVLRGWVVGNRWNGCTTASTTLVTCKLTTPTATKRSLLFTSGGKSVTTKLPTGSRYLCGLTGACVAVKSGQSVTINGSARWLVGA